MKARSGLLLILLGVVSPIATSVLANDIPQLDYRVLSQLPHSRSDFTQGLEIRDGVLYQGTGLVGQSRIQAFDLASGQLLREQALPRPYFGEGITVIDDRVLQLSWRARQGFIYRRSDFAPLGGFSLDSEGWGLTNDGERLIYSDGSDVLRFLNPDSFEVTGSIQIRRGDTPLKELNELEWTPHGLWANVWRRDVLVRIDLDSGQVTGEVDLRGLLPRSRHSHGTDVLNGIAYNPKDDSFWVTGKNWPLLFQLKILDPSAPVSP